MPTTYAGILNGNVNFNGVNFGADVPVPNLWGADFVAQCNGNGLTPAANMGQIAQDFHAALRLRNWRWSPLATGDNLVSAARLLDGTVNEGECAFVARALALLVNAPAPWGFGAGGAAVQPYNGANGSGFIAAHGANALPGAEPNITRENGGTLQGYYLWGNHKVVAYNGAYYDPCYNVQYAGPANMAAASLQTIRANANPADLRWYDTRSWGGWFANIGRSIYNAFWSAQHRLEVLQAGGGPAAVNGYYIGWQENWNSVFGEGARVIWYGPFAANPLFR